MHVGVVPSEDGDTEVRPLMLFERKRPEREFGPLIMDGSFCVVACRSSPIYRVE